MSELKANLVYEELGERYENVRNRETILELVNAGERVVFLTNTLSESMEHELDFVVAAVLKRYGRESLQSTLYTAVKEMVVNATRANAKLIWFEERGLDIRNPDDYHAGMAELNGRYDEAWIETYGARARERSLSCEIVFEHSVDGLRIMVYSAALNPAEEGRIREKFRESMGYEDLVAFYMAHADQSEGEGLGLALIVLLLKAEGVDPHLFRIGVVEGRTLARIEVPFTANFQSVRGGRPDGKR